MPCGFLTFLQDVNTDCNQRAKLGNCPPIRRVPACFQIGDHFDRARYELTVHSFAEPGDILARAVISQDHSKLDGDASAWTRVPTLYVEYLRFEPWKDYVLLRVLPESGRIEVQRLGWYDDSYDKGYQGAVSVLEAPGERFAIVSVQRSSRLIFHDLNTGSKTGELDLGGRGGNPLLQFHKSGTEIWATDYDTVVVIQRSNWRCFERPGYKVRRSVGSAGSLETSPLIQTRKFVLLRVRLAETSLASTP